MQRHYIYITSDVNRTYLEAGNCNDIALKLFELQQASNTFMLNSPRFSRIVYMEELENHDLAIKRKHELNAYTKMQKERLIRKMNPNWLAITHSNTLINNKVVVYA